MIKKIVLSLMLLLSLTLLMGCKDNNESKDSILPDLSGMTKTQAMNALSGLKITIVFDDVVNNDAIEGTFSHYGNSLNAGSKVDPQTTVTVYFFIKEVIDGVRLPDLTGLNEEEIIDILIELDLFYVFETFATNDVDPGLFAKYSSNYQSGMVIPNGTWITVFLATIFVEFNDHLIISKYVEGLSQNKAVEIANMSEETIDLSEYDVSLYINGEENASVVIPLNGNLLPGEVFIIVYSESEQALKEQADLISSHLIFDGNDAVAITKQGVVVDVIGLIGVELFILRNETFVRKEHITTNSRTYSSSNWDIYAIDNFGMLGSHPVAFPESFTFTNEQTQLPFSTPSGMALVDYVYANDGDTSTFTPGFLGDNRVRFIGIDTPEMHGTPDAPQPWATEATMYLRGLLENADEIYIQHDPAAGPADTYGRALGLVWADGVLTNYMMVLMGYSAAMYNDEQQRLIFNGVSLNRWFERAQQDAMANNRGIWSTTPR